jgi:hypothetical protein
MPNPALPENSSPTTRIGFVQNAQVEFDDMISEQVATLAEIGKGIIAAQGVINGLPVANAYMPPLAVATNGTMNISLGGTKQGVVCGGYVCDGTQATPFVVPAADPSQQRIDLIAIQPAVAPSGTTITRNILVAGVPTPGPEPLNLYATNTVYVAGTPGGGAPAAPAGYYAFATVTVPATATAINAGNIAYLFPTLNPAGPTGHGATATSATFVVPAVAATVVIAVDDNFAFPVNAFGLISDGAHTIAVQVTAAAGSTSLTVKNLQTVAGSPGDTMALDAIVTFTGSQGAAGSPGAPGAPGPTGPAGADAFTTTTSNATIPAVGSGVSVPFAAIASFPVGDVCLISDGTHAFAGLITGYSSLTATVVCSAITLGAAGDTVTSGAKVVPSAAISPGAKGTSEFAAGPVTASGSLTLPTLPGDASVTYIVRAQVTGSLHDSNKNCVLTGTGATWANSGISGTNGSGPIFVVVMYGTATGGQAPEVIWTLDDSIGGQVGVAEILAVAQ